MAATGIVLGLFVVGHLVGNLLIFKGQDSFNAYADYLKGHPLLWVFRLGMLAVLAVHVFTSIQLYRENRVARGQRYACNASVNSKYASRHMMFSGLMLFVFLILHLFHFTIDVSNAEVFHAVDNEGRPDIYAMVVAGFQRPSVALAYVIAMLMLGLHLIHATLSFFQTLGFSYESNNHTIRRITSAFVALLVVGFCSIPAFIYLDYIPITAGGGGP